MKTTATILCLLLSVSIVLSHGFPTFHNTNKNILRNYNYNNNKMGSIAKPTTAKTNIAPTPNAFSTRGGSSKGNNNGVLYIPGTPMLYAESGTGPIPTESKCPASATMAIFGSVWGTLGVAYILGKAIKRVLPIALEPFNTPNFLTPFQWGLYAVTCLFFAYAEGYKGFQTKFSPMVVKRSCSLVVGTPQGTVLNYLIAPLYSMGFVHATRKRKIVSWSLSTGIAMIVYVVKKFVPPPYKQIVDGGVVVGLSWGLISMLMFYVKAWATGKLPDVDACFPTTTTTKNKAE